MMIFSFLYHFIWKLIQLSCADLEEDGGLGSPPPPEIVFGSAQDCVFFFTMMQWQMCHGYFTCFLIVKVLYTEGPLNGLFNSFFFKLRCSVTNRVFWCDKQCKNGNSNNRSSNITFIDF